MSESPPTRCERFPSDVTYFDKICDNCKEHYIKKNSLKFHRIKIWIYKYVDKICKLVSVKKSLNWVNIYTCGCCFEVKLEWDFVAYI